MSRTGTGVSSERKRLSVFLSYAHADEKQLIELKKQFAFQRRSGTIETWHDRKIGPGDDWAKTIDTQLELADVILLLVSLDFADSDYCWHVETQRALERGQQGAARVVPVIVLPAARLKGRRGSRKRDHVVLSYRALTILGGRP